MPQQFDQKAGESTTPSGPNFRHVVRVQVIGDRVDELGGVKVPERYLEFKVITPHSAHRAVGLVVAHLSEQEPSAVWLEIDVHTDVEFTWSDDDLVDWYARAP